MTRQRAELVTADVTGLKHVSPPRTGKESNLRNVAPETNAQAMLGSRPKTWPKITARVCKSNHMLVSKPFLKRSRARFLPGPPLITLRVNNGTRFINGS